MFLFSNGTEIFNHADDTAMYARDKNITNVVYILGRDANVLENGFTTTCSN